MNNNELTQAIFEMVTSFPASTTNQLIDLLETIEGAPDWKTLKSQLAAIFPQPVVREQLDSFVAQWKASASLVSPDTIALALKSAAHIEQYHRNKEQIELVWTGPRVHDVNLRRIDGALLEIINAAHEQLDIVSFAVYKARYILGALEDAVERGVRVRMFLETPDSSENKVTYSTINALGKKITDSANIYIWPLHLRETNSDGKHGSLHAKVAIGDRHRMLISSANLTGYAMNLNIEAGIVVNGGELPKTVLRQLERLIENGVFIRP